MTRLQQLSASVIQDDSEGTMIASNKKAYFFAGIACAAIALPFGIIAAALTPVAIGFAKGVYDHYVVGTAGPANFAWMIAGDAAFVGGIKLMQGTLWT